MVQNPVPFYRSPYGRGMAKMVRPRPRADTHSHFHRRYGGLVRDPQSDPRLPSHQRTVDGVLHGNIWAWVTQTVAPLPPHLDWARKCFWFCPHITDKAPFELVHIGPGYDWNLPGPAYQVRSHLACRVPHGMLLQYCGAISRILIKLIP